MATSKQELVLYGANESAIVSKRNNYEIQGVMGGTTQTLKRNVDFGVIKGTKKPTLYKSGSEKVIKAFGLLTRYTTETKIEQVEPSPFFYYGVKCELIKIHPETGVEYVFATGFGSSNTNERRNGNQSAFDGANAAWKMACKRAMVMAAITIGGLSDMFEMDLENESFMAKSNEINANESDSSAISAKQVKRIFALATQAGYSVEEAKTKLQAEGFASTKDITIGQYDKVCELFKEKK